MELRHFRYFIAVAEARHFSRAAEALHMAQPPLSQQIQGLEAELGVPLLKRTKRSVELTAAGEAFLQEARKVVAQAEHAVVVARQAHNGMLGQLTIGFVGIAMAEKLPALLKAYRKHYPTVDTKLQNLVTTEQVRALHEGWIEVGIIHPPILDSSLCLEHIGHEPLVVVLPANHALAKQEDVAIRQLCEETFVMYPRLWNPGLFDQVVSLCQQAGFSMQLGQEALGWESIIELVAADFGVSLVPASSHRLYRREVVYRRLRENAPALDLALAWLADNDSAILQHFLQVARSTMRE